MASSGAVSFTSVAAQFSSRYLRRLVPGMGTMSSPWASSQASATCPAVARFAAASCLTFSTSFRFAARFSPWKRGKRIIRASVAGSVPAPIAPVSRPRPSGLYGTKPIPSSRVVFKISASTWRSKIEYSVWSALIGCTACARRIVFGLASDSPRKRTLPAFTSSAIAPTVSSIGTVLSTRCW